MAAQSPEAKPNYSIQDLPNEERPRERLEQLGSSALSVAELIAVVIGTGYQNENVLQLARKILYEHNGIEGLSKANTQEMMQTKGVGNVKALQLQAAFELGRRLSVSGENEVVRITCPEDAANFLMPRLSHLEQEHMQTILLNTRNDIIAAPTIYKGSLNVAVIRVAEVFRPAIRQNAAAIILGHNHPSGDPSPSSADIRVTREIVKAGKMLNIGVKDHIVVGKGRYNSLKIGDYGIDW